jgi:hypothetical protein
MKAGKCHFVILLIGINCASISSCKTVEPKRAGTDEGIMYAMIYDYENNPVTGADVFIDGKKYAESDINGRFILELTKPGYYLIRVTKKNYENLEQEFKFDPMNVLYLKMANASQLLVLAENAIDLNDHAEADAMINRALSLEKYRPDALFLKSISLYLQHRYAESEETLRSLINNGYEDDSVLKLLSILEENRD